MISVVFNGIELKYVSYELQNGKPTFIFTHNDQQMALYYVNDRWKIGIDSKPIRDNELYLWLHSIRNNSDYEAKRFANFLFKKSPLRLEFLFIFKKTD